MSKRRAGTELTHDNWDQEEEEEQEEAGNFQAADETTIAKRQIKKAKRRFAGGEKAEASSNPFSAFQGFGGFSSATAATTKKPEVTFGGKDDKPKVALTPAESTAPVISSFVMKSSSNRATSSESKSVNGNSSAKMNPEYLKKLKALNQSVSAWIQKHVDASPMCDLTPVFEDYKKHLQELEKKYSDMPATSESTSSTDAKASATSPGAAGFNFGKSATTTAPSQSAAFSFKATSASSGAPTGAAAPTTAGAGFSFLKSGSATTTTSAPSQAGFSFKPTQASTGAAPGGFSFMKGSTEPSTSGAAKPFSFGLGTSSAPAKEGGGASGDAEDEPPKVEFKQVEEKDALYSKRCKLFYKKDDTYKDRGVGMLHLKKMGDRAQLLLRADTNLGNVILNVGIQSGMPATRQGKNNVLIMTAMNPPIGKKCPKCNKNYPNPQESNRCEDDNCSPEVEPILLRVKTGEDADQLLEEINKLKG